MCGIGCYDGIKIDHFQCDLLPDIRDFLGTAKKKHFDLDSTNIPQINLELFYSVNATYQATISTESSLLPKYATNLYWSPAGGTATLTVQLLPPFVNFNSIVFVSSSKVT